MVLQGSLPLCWVFRGGGKLSMILSTTGQPNVNVDVLCVEILWDS